MPQAFEVVAYETINKKVRPLLKFKDLHLGINQVLSFFTSKVIDLSFGVLS